jgi:anti-sigma regulatory factor (Ser/Thr protein kinase)
MIDARIGFAVDDLAENSVIEFLRQLQPVHSSPSGAAWRLSLTDKYYGPTTAVVVAALVLSATAQQQQCAVDLPIAPRKLKAFWSFSGLASLIADGAIAPPSDLDPPESETAPLQQFRRMNWSGSTPMVRLIRRHLPRLAADSEELLRSCYAEIAQNIEDHAKSPIGGVVCARYFSSLQEIRIAVADRGLGIGETLRLAKDRTNVTIDNDAHALKLVLAGNVSSKSRPNNMGQGISILGTVAAGSGGRLMIVSGKAHATVDSRGTNLVQHRDTLFPGTLVLLKLPVTATETDSAHDGE